MNPRQCRGFILMHAMHRCGALERGPSLGARWLCYLGAHARRTMKQCSAPVAPKPKTLQSETSSHYVVQELQFLARPLSCRHKFAMAWPDHHKFQALPGHLWL